MVPESQGRACRVHMSPHHTPEPAADLSHSFRNIQCGLNVSGPLLHTVAQDRPSLLPSTRGPA